MSIDPKQLTSKHTPGPWKIGDLYLHGRNIDTVVEMCEGLAVAYGFEDELDANAHLISAAPEAIEFIADLIPTFELMKATGLFDAEAVNKVISDAETILKKAYNL